MNILLQNQDLICGIYDCTFEKRTGFLSKIQTINIFSNLIEIIAVVGKWISYISERRELEENIGIDLSHLSHLFG